MAHQNVRSKPVASVAAGPGLVSCSSRITVRTAAPNEPPTCCRIRVALLALGTCFGASPVEAALIAALLEVARTITVLPERAALIRLIIAEATRFPMLVQPWRDRGTVTDIISAQLSRLADRGLLTFDDPVQATQHLSALTLSQLNTRSLFGTLPLTDAEIEQVIRSGVHVYLLAYGPRP